MIVTDPPGYPLGQPAGPRHAAPTTYHSGASGVDDRSVAQAREDGQRRAWEAEMHARVLRGAAATRLELFNLRHAEHAWQLRNRFGVAATAVVLLYLDQTPQWTFRVAGKLFADSDQMTDPGRVLYDVTVTLREILAGGGDPRSEWCETPEEMTGQAVYYGAAVSLLDTPAGTWRDLKRDVVGGGPFVPGRVLAWLADGTLLAGDRFRHDHPSERYVVDASNRLAAGWGSHARLWHYRPDLAELTDPASRPLWLRLYELHTLYTGGEREH